MANRERRRPKEGAAVTLAEACRQIGISVPGAETILSKSPHDLPPTFKLGHRRFVMREHLQAWLDARLALGPVAGHITQRCDTHGC